jgi:hypothetical protein
VANIVLEVNRQVGIDPGTLPRCRLADLEGTSIPGAERVCGEAEVGRGRAWERLDPPDAEFGSSAQLAAFNARVHGHPGILVHGVFGTPIANTFTMAFELKKSRGAGKNTFPTLLSAEVPAAVQSAGPLTGFELTLSGRHAVNRGYLSASCPAPSGFAGTGATFPLLRLELGFEGGAILSSNLLPSCTPR